jgi:peroxiredoxin
LLDFQRSIAEFEKKNIRILAASSDTEEDAGKTVDKYGLTFSVGFGLIPSEVSAITGAFFNLEKNHLHATGFIVSPEGKIENAVYSSSAIGRLTASDCLSYINYMMSL